jgi:stage V sporulation protein D (sporulation-specific penicillin-binding protein)
VPADIISLASTRLRHLKIFGGALLCLIVLRVGYLKVGWAEYYAALADETTVTVSRPPDPTPGSFLDCHNRRVAYSERVYTVAVEPAKVRAAGVSDQAARALAAQLGGDYQTILEAINAPAGRWKPIAYHIPPSTADKVRSLKITGVTCAPTFMRKYPYGRVGCHLVGLRGRDHSPLDGIEKMYRFLIDGVPGTPRTNVDAYGRLIVGQEDAPVLPPEPGKDVVLAVDMDLQQVADEALDECMARNQPTTATCVVFDVRTGAIRALASRPNYDPNAIAGGPTDGTKVQSPPQINQAPLPVVRAFEPGSTFKILTATAAIELGVADESTSFHCSGQEEIGGKPLKCWGKYATEGHGDITLPQMLTLSCNLFAAHLAMRIGPERFVKFLENAGIGSPTHCGYPYDAAGTLHPASQLRTRDLANMGFGQNVSVTDVQLLAAASACVNGGVLLQPRVVDRVLTADGALYSELQPVSLRRVCSERTSARVRKMLRAVVDVGTGKPARIPGVAVGGKTGTAQKWGSEDGQWRINGYIMSFMLFVPIDTVPRYAILVTAEDPKQGEHGSDVAAPAARKVALEICRSSGLLTEAQYMKARTPAAPG